MLILLLSPKIVSLYNKKDFKRVHTRPDMNIREKLIYYAWLCVFLAINIVSFFIPFSFESPLYVIGLFLSVFGLFLHLFTTHTYLNTAKNRLIKTGIYKISRNPGYFSTSLYSLGVSFMTNSFILLVLTLLFFLLYQVTVKYEERMCENIYKEEFVEYKNNTSKNFLFF